MHRPLACLVALICALPGSESVLRQGFEAETLPEGWRTMGWSAPAPAPGAVAAAASPNAAAGARVLRITAPASGSIGVSAPAIPITAGSPTLRVQAQVRVEGRGVRPWAFLTCWAGAAFLGRIDLKTPKAGVAGWSQISGGARPDELPAGTDRVVLNLAAQNSGADATGAVEYDEIAIFDDPAEFRLAAEGVGSWLAPGEALVLRAAGGHLPAALHTMELTAFDSAGREVGHGMAARADIETDGLRWTPPGPGLYELALTCVLADGSRVPHHERWPARRPDGTLVECVRERIACAVARVPTRPASERWPVMGISCGEGPEVLDLADRLGVAFVRYHWIPWGWQWNADEIIEPEPGKLNWKVLDERIAHIRKLGLGFVGNVVTTPRWASPKPADDSIDICIVRWSTYAPTDLTVWTRFLDTIVRRYPDALAWELWNEPHLPGGSVFWHDSPEAFVRLLNSGYQAVKTANPQVPVWIGGLGGRRYLPFYKELLRQGGGLAYDRLALHGTWCDPTPFRAQDRTAGIPERPWVNSEFHATLIGRDNGPMPSEAAIAKRMLIDLLSQVAKGAERIALFETANNTEREMLAATGDGIVDGFYRKRPRYEPRLAAVVIQRLGTLFGREVRVTAQAVLDDQRAAVFSSDGRPLLLFWSDATAPQPAQAAIAAAIAGSRVTDWEGRDIPAGAPLEPGVLYWAEDAGSAVVSLATRTGEALASDRQRRIAAGPGMRGRATTATAAPLWHDGWNFVGVDGKTRPEGFDARFSCALRDNRLELTVEVQDRIHRPNPVANQYWQGDSVQIGIDTLGDGIPREDVKLQVAVSPAGAVLWKEACPYIGGDLPQGWTPAQQPVGHGGVTVEEMPGGKRYRIVLDTTELYPWRFDPAQPLRLSVLVNDDDGQGRLGWLEWGGGIGGGADPGLFGSLTWTSGP